MDVEVGIPQGYILGPLLFLLYINDIYKISSKLSYILFADDTNIFVKGKSLPDVCKIINSELEYLNKWLQANKLSLNVSKTNCMILSSSGKIFDKMKCKININGPELIFVNETKFLGIIVDNKLSWKSHINHVHSKISKGVGILYRARQLVYGETLQTLYESLIKPYFEYCVTIWGNTYNTYLNKLHLLQKKLVRILTYSDYIAPTKGLMKARKIMTIYAMHKYYVGLFVYKSLNNLFPDFMCNIFKPNINARNSLNLHVFYCKRKWLNLI